MPDIGAPRRRMDRTGDRGRRRPDGVFECIGRTGYLPGFATPRVVCDVPYVGKRWLHQVTRYAVAHGVSW